MWPASLTNCSMIFSDVIHFQTLNQSHWISVTGPYFTLYYSHSYKTQTLHCLNRFGPELLFKLVSLNNNLSTLHIWSCGNITQSIRDQVQEYLDRHFLDVSFQWSGVPEEDDEDNDFLNEEDDLQNLLLPLVGVNILPNVE